MPYFPGRDARRLLVLSQTALGLTNQELGRLVGVSMRTVVRWWAGQSSPSASDVVKVARAVHPRRADLAAALAAEVGETLQSLGLVAPPAPPAPASLQTPPGPPPRPFPPTRLLIEAIVGATADAMHAPPSAVRPAVLAAFSCARELGLSLQEVEEALVAQVGARTAGAAGPVAAAVTPAAEPGSSAAR
jgi:transcriptional regulator with XRE-family HTH domain